MKMIIANFKSNKNKTEIEDWIKHYSTLNSQLSTAVVLCPPMPHLAAFHGLINEHTFLGVQDVSPFPAGSYTGAVGTHNLMEMGIKYAIVGHSERRKYFHETNQEIAKKVRECLAASITPIVCVTKDEINSQANALDAAERSQCIVAFEPIEHIGTGESDTLAHIMETKQWVHTAFGNVPYVYGGSVNQHTDPAILTSSEIDGYLVGSASLDAESFFDLVSKVQ